MDRLFRDNKKIAIGMCVPLPFPGSYKHKGESMALVVEQALEQAAVYNRYSYDGMLIQNFYNIPNLQISSVETVAYMTVLAAAIKKDFPALPLGLMMVWDGLSSLAVADAVGAEFIRVEHAYIGAEMTPAGIMNGQCVEITQLRKKVDSKVLVYADVYEPHAVQVCPKQIEDASFEALCQCHADGLYISGHTVDESIALAAKVHNRVPTAKVILGSGSTGENVFNILQHYDGVCVGTWIKDGNVLNAINPEKAERYMNEVRRARGD